MAWPACARAICPDRPAFSRKGDGTASGRQVRNRFGQVIHVWIPNHMAERILGATACQGQRNHSNRLILLSKICEPKADFHTEILIRCDACQLFPVRLRVVEENTPALLPKQLN